jgi:hypothetical protein
MAGTMMAVGRAFIQLYLEQLMYVYHSSALSLIDRDLNK